MNFRILKNALRKAEKNVPKIDEAVVTEVSKNVEAEQIPRSIPSFQRPPEKVVGGDVLWKPIDKQAAILISKAPWWAQPVYENTKIETKKSKPDSIRGQKEKSKLQQKIPRTKTKISNMSEPELMNHQTGDKTLFGNIKGITPARHNEKGPLYRLTDIQDLIIQSIEALPKETRPTVRSAEDARQIIQELLVGITVDMDKFKSNTKMYLEDIRQTRFAVVTETAQMTKELKDVRQFFLGSDYKEQIERLKEFVSLCEKLQKLKESGFLDKVADTMLRLAVG